MFFGFVRLALADLGSLDGGPLRSSDVRRFVALLTFHYVENNLLTVTHRAQKFLRVVFHWYWLEIVISVIFKD